MSNANRPSAPTNAVARRPAGNGNGNGNGGQLQARPQDNYLTSFAEVVRANKGALRQIAADQTDLKRLYQIVLSCFTKNPDLFNCSRESVLRSMMQCAELGLTPTSALGEVYMVPYGRECQAIIGYRGFINLARRSGEVKTIQAQAVFEGDHFDYRFGLNPVCDHIPSGEERDPNRITHVWASATFKDGSFQFDVMTRAEVDRIRTRSRAGGKGPWVTDYAEMAKKTVVRRLAKYLPMSVEMARAVEISDANEFGDAMEVSFVDKPDSVSPAMDDPTEDDPTDPPAPSATSARSIAAPSPTARPDSPHLKSHKGFLANRGYDPDDVDASCRLLAWALQRDSLTLEERDSLTDEEWKSASSALVKLDRNAIPAIVNGPDEPDGPEGAEDQDNGPQRISEEGAI